MNDAPITVRAMPGGRYCIDDGERALDICPCCGLIFTNEQAANAVKTAIENGKITMDGAFAIAETWHKFRLAI